MKETSTWQFGLLIAYLLPGFIGLAGLSPFLPVVGQWLRPTDQTFGLGPTVYAILAAITVGMIASCIRWLLIDHLHGATGIIRPKWNTTDIQSRLGAFNYFVEAHYRYYQFYANTIVALLFSYVLNRILKTSPLLGFGTDLGVTLLSLSRALLRVPRRPGEVLRRDESSRQSRGERSGYQHDKRL